MKIIILKILKLIGIKCYLSEFRKNDKLWCGPNYWSFSRVNAEQRAKRNGHIIVGLLVDEVPCDFLTEIQIRRKNIQFRRENGSFSGLF